MLSDWCGVKRFCGKWCERKWFYYFKLWKHMLCSTFDQFRQISMLRSICVWSRFRIILCISRRDVQKKSDFLNFCSKTTKKKYKKKTKTIQPIWTFNYRRIPGAFYNNLLNYIACNNMSWCPRFQYSASFIKFQREGRWMSY